jgi:hypothetical protein
MPARKKKPARPTLSLPLDVPEAPLPPEEAIDAPSSPAEASCEGNLHHPADPSTWRSWLNIADPVRDGEFRPRLFCSHACLCRWIYAGGSTRGAGTCWGSVSPRSVHYHRRRCRPGGGGSRKDHEMTDEDNYIQRYFWDPEISALLDEYLDHLREGLDVIRVGVPAEEAVSSDLDDLSRRIREAIAERIWDEFPALHRDDPPDQQWVADLTEERDNAFYQANFWPLAF